jgi:hypothetical protein
MGYRKYFTDREEQYDIFSAKEKTDTYFNRQWLEIIDDEDPSDLEEEIDDNPDNEVIEEEDDNNSLEE